LALFGSTSPSYLILQSLDAVNGYLAEGYSQKLAEFLTQVEHCKKQLRAQGYTLCGEEPMKLTLRSKEYGYQGEDLAHLLAEKGVVCEFADPDFTILMLTPEIGMEGLARLTKVLEQIPKLPRINKQPPTLSRAERVMTARQATLAPHKQIPTEEAEGRILGSPSVGCPPAVPILICGERIDQHTIQVFQYYGILTCTVVKE